MVRICPHRAFGKKASESPNHPRTIKKCFGGCVESHLSADSKLVNSLQRRIKAAAAARSKRGWGGEGGGRGCTRDIDHCI